MSTTISEDAPLDVSVYRSPQDGALVVEIDTVEDTGRLRVNLNDAPIWNRDPEEAPLIVEEIAEEVISGRYGDVPTFRFAMAQDGPPLDAQGVLSLLREAVARGMDYRDDL